jgi:hypothetical protein
LGRSFCGRWGRWECRLVSGRETTGCTKDSECRWCCSCMCKFFLKKTTNLEKLCANFCLRRWKLCFFHLFLCLICNTILLLVILTLFPIFKFIYFLIYFI